VRRPVALTTPRGGFYDGPPDMKKELLRVEKINKSFPGVHALKDVSLRVDTGEVLALVGENGAGKSTLMNILSGIHQKDSGAIHIEGREVVITSPLHSQQLGISIIHQELNLVPHFNVAENIFVGQEKRQAGVFLDRKKTRAEAQVVLDRVGLSIDAATLVRHLTIAQRQMVEIAKALSRNAKLIVMDEPTSSISDREIERLFKIIRDLKGAGVSVIFISHKLDEVFAIADRISVMRDGELVGELDPKVSTEDNVIQMMVGREITSIFPKVDVPIAGEIFAVKDLKRGGGQKGLSFSLRRGEILGFAGLVGAGRSELLQAIFGIDRRDAGEIILEGAPVQIRSPQEAIRLGIGFVPEDRKLKGLMLGLAVKDNVTIASLQKVSSRGVMSTARERSAVEGYIKKLAIKTSGQDQLALHLSGGNQQKVVLAKWLAIKPKILIVDEPTRGVDVGAKSEIHSIMSQLAGEGVSIIMISSELPEILGMSDRIIVMHEGEITGELLRGAATQEKILAMALSRESA
jgi:ABC-type sugar transport system ATPase subunit